MLSLSATQFGTAVLRCASIATSVHPVLQYFTLLIITFPTLLCQHPIQLLCRRKALNSFEETLDPLVSLPILRRAPIAHVVTPLRPPSKDFFLRMFASLLSCCQRIVGAAADSAAALVGQGESTRTPWRPVVVSVQTMRGECP